MRDLSRLHPFMWTRAIRGPDASPNASLLAWRRKAADALLAAVAALHLPPLVLVILGYGPPMGPLVKAAAFTAYAVVAAAAVLRQIEHGARLWAAFGAVYLAIFIMNIALPRGPYAQAGLVILPAFGLVLLGAAFARIAVVACAMILVSASFLRVLPGVARALAIDPSQAAVPPGLVWMQTAALAGFLFMLMILLDRFYRFLERSLAVQRRVTADLEREAAERSAVQRKMEDEIRERHRLEREIAAVGDAERRRLGHELHDGVCQQVTAALLRCQALERRLERGGTLSGADFAPLSSLLAETIEEARNVALGLCPVEPDPHALAPELGTLAKRTLRNAGVRCEFSAAGDVSVPDPVSAQHLYRVAQEALSNVVRHAGASRVTVELRGSDKDLLLQVEDDGVGLPAEFPAGGMGLRTMAWRARILEGELTVAPAVGGGVRVACRVPRGAGTATRGHSGDERWTPAK